MGGGRRVLTVMVRGVSDRRGRRMMGRGWWRRPRRWKRRGRRSWWCWLCLGVFFHIEWINIICFVVGFFFAFSIKLEHLSFKFFHAVHYIWWKLWPYWMFVGWSAVYHHALKGQEVSLPFSCMRHNWHNFTNKHYETIKAFHYSMLQLSLKLLCNNCES